MSDPAQAIRDARNGAQVTTGPSTVGNVYHTTDCRYLTDDRVQTRPLTVSEARQQRPRKCLACKRQDSDTDAPHAPWGHDETGTDPCPLCGREYRKVANHIGYCDGGGADDR